MNCNDHLKDKFISFLCIKFLCSFITIPISKISQHSNLNVLSMTVSYVKRDSSIIDIATETSDTCVNDMIKTESYINRY